MLLATLILLVLLMRSEGEGATEGTFHVPGTPTAIVVAANRVWVAVRPPGAVWEIDATTGRELAPPLRTGGAPGRLAVGASGGWVADTERGAVVPLRWRPRRRVYRPIRLGADVADVALARRALWVAGSTEGVVRVLEPSGVRTFPAGNDPVDIDANDRWVVAAAAGSGTLARFDARTRRTVGPAVPVGGVPVAVALAGDDAWVADVRRGTLSHVDVRRGTVRGAPLDVCLRPTAVAADGADVYVLCRGDRTLAHVDGMRMSVLSRRSVGPEPAALALDAHHAWVADAANRTVVRLDR